MHSVADALGRAKVATGRVVGRFGAVLVMITACAAVFGSPAARADAFRSPSGNIACTGGVDDRGFGAVACDIAEHDWAPPPRPPNCHQGWGDRFALHQGAPPVIECHGDTLRVPALPSLSYGQARTLGAIRCDSRTTGMTCTDTSSGSFFTLSRARYDLYSP